jgi:hypothetical protein
MGVVNSTPLQQTATHKHGGMVLTQKTTEEQKNKRTKDEKNKTRAYHTTHHTHRFTLHATRTGQSEHTS